MTVQCHYAILSIAQDADAATIKKAHRKLALKYHPDKNPNDEEATHQFRLVQAAYECLSDEKERKWYDEHREAILRGWDGNHAEGVDKEGVVFDVVPYQFGGCYDGYDDDDDGFYAVYSRVFEELYKCEMKQWTSMGNIDESTFPLQHLNTPFGNSSSDYSTVVSQFYGCWESYNTICKYAWVDEYDVREAPNRRIRRAMEEENSKKRKTARRERNEEVLSLVRFVKRRDPRVKKRMEELKKEKSAKELERKKEMERRKSEAAAAREAWREEAEKMREELEKSDLQAGKIRLADLDSEEEDSDYDYGGGGGKKKKKNRRKSKKKKKSKGKKKKNRYVEEEEESNQEKDNNGENDVNAVDDEEQEDLNDEQQQEEIEQDLIKEKDESEPDEESSSESEEEEPEVYRCEACKKDFKSSGQLKKHQTSKKHRESFKKYDQKQSILLEKQRQKELEEEKRRKLVEEAEDSEEEESVEGLEEDEAMAELLDEMALESNEDEDKDESDTDDDNIQNSTPSPFAAAASLHQLSSSSEESSSSSEEEEEEEPDFYRCECCKKDFKSSGQLENHMKSKKHRESFKKYQQKQKK